MASVTDVMLRLRPERFEWRSWQGEAVIYDGASGLTHRVVKPSGYVLELLAAAPSGLHLETLSARLSGEASTSQDAALAQTLDALAELGIVEEIGVENR